MGRDRWQLRRNESRWPEKVNFQICFCNSCPRGSGTGVSVLPSRLCRDAPPGAQLRHRFAARTGDIWSGSQARDASCLVSTGRSVNDVAGLQLNRCQTPLLGHKGDGQSGNQGVPGRVSLATFGWHLTAPAFFAVTRVVGTRDVFERASGWGAGMCRRIAAAGPFGVIWRGCGGCGQQCACRRTLGDQAEPGLMRRAWH